MQSYKHKSATRPLIPSKEEAGMEETALRDRKTKNISPKTWIPAVNGVRDFYPELEGAEWRFLAVSGEVRGLKQSILSKLNL